MEKVFCCWYNGGCQMPQAYGRTLAEAQENFIALNGFYNDVIEELEDATEWKLKLCENPKAIFD